MLQEKREKVNEEIGTVQVSNVAKVTARFAMGDNALVLVFCRQVGER